MNYNKFKLIISLLVSAGIAACSGCAAATSDKNTAAFPVETAETASAQDDTLEEGEVWIDLNANPGLVVKEPVSSKTESKAALVSSESKDSEKSEKPDEESSEAASSANEYADVDENGEPLYRRELIEKRDTSIGVPLSVHTGSPVDESWFDDCIFLGDSFTAGLGVYNDAFGELGNAEIVGSACIGWVSSQYDWYNPDGFHPLYRGQQVFMYDLPAITESNKVVITLGMNDVCGMSNDYILANAETFIEKIRYLRPGAKIYITTVTPMIESAQFYLLNNERIRDFNSCLLDFAWQHNCGFLDTYSLLADDEGNLPVEWCIDAADKGFHLNNEGNHILCEFYKENLG